MHCIRMELKSQTYFWSLVASDRHWPMFEMLQAYNLGRLNHGAFGVCLGLKGFSLFGKIVKELMCGNSGCRF